MTFTAKWHRQWRPVAGGLALLAGACTPAFEETKVPDKPQLEGLPAGYRLLDRTDTLLSYKPDVDNVDSTGSMSLSGRVVVAVRFVPASAMRQAGLDTLTFRHTSHYLDPLPRAGYNWYFTYLLDQGKHFEDDAQLITRRVSAPITDRLILTEQAPDGRERNSYLMDYPFAPAGLAPVSDSVVYVRVYPIRQDVRQADTYAMTHYERRGPDRLQLVPVDSIRVPYYRDIVDSSRFANLCLTLRRLPLASPAKAR